MEVKQGIRGGKLGGGISLAGLSVSENSISFDSYEKMAEYYFECVDTKPYNAYYERPATLSLLPDVAGKRVLDAGCAAGWYTKWLVDKDANVVAVDFSPGMLAMTRKRVGDKVDIRRADLNEPLDFLDDNSMDIVLSSLTLHYVRHWPLVMAEFYRILKPAGALIFSVHHPFMDFAYFNRDNYFATEIIEDIWPTNSGAVRVQFYRRPLSQILSPVIDAGFIIEKLLEPMPTEKFKELHPQDYERLTHRPQFLFLRARKS